MNLINKIKKKNILVIGDVMLDIYYIGDVNRISPEAPVPVFRKRKEKSVLGGAANVAANLIAANQRVSIMTLIGDDANGKILEQNFLEQGIDINLIVKSTRNTTSKTRFVATNNQQVMRLDVEDTDVITSEECNMMLTMLKEKISEYDLIVFSDYLKGLMTYEFTQGVIQIANDNQVKVLIDVKDSNYEKYTGAFLLKPNLSELRSLTNMPVGTNDEIILASRQLKKLCNCEYVLTTCGARGMILVGETLNFSIDSVGKEVFDVTGAGDTTIAYIAACIANIMEIKEAVEISNYAAGLQVAKMGTSSVCLQEVSDSFTNGKQGIIHKLISQDAVLYFRETHKDKKIVFTNGCFDILHVGHIRYLQKARLLGDILVIGLNSDISVKRLKGELRPINTEKDRAELLCALEYVDYVVIFNEDTPRKLIKKIQPDILVKGGDYKPDDVVGKDIVEARGGRLELLQFIEGKSTTNIIERIKN
jgi:D-beta-D-heptose 7-phosphate kinase/D-beta-D-heptose 1-phosphate adenosyltransferase